MSCSFPEPCEFPSLDSCQKRFLWTHKRVHLAPQPVVDLVHPVGDAERFPHALRWSGSFSRSIACGTVTMRGGIESLAVISLLASRVKDCWFKHGLLSAEACRSGTANETDSEMAAECVNTFQSRSAQSPSGTPAGRGHRGCRS